LKKTYKELQLVYTNIDSFD